MGEQRQRDRVRCDSDDLIFEIASLVASETGKSPIELYPPLGKRIDGDALQQLVDSAPASLRVEFRYQGREIVVETGSEVTIRTSRADE